MRPVQPPVAIAVIIIIIIIIIIIVVVVIIVIIIIIIIVIIIIVIIIIIIIIIIVILLLPPPPPLSSSPSLPFSLRTASLTEIPLRSYPFYLTVLLMRDAQVPPRRAAPRQGATVPCLRTQRRGMSGCVRGVCAWLRVMRALITEVHACMHSA
eukprot:COSAG01_NODE_1197_length_11296_cov_113.645262_2_plen_153_part_00